MCVMVSGGGLENKQNIKKNNCVATSSNSSGGGTANPRYKIPSKNC